MHIQLNWQVLVIVLPTPRVALHWQSRDTVTSRGSSWTRSLTSSPGSPWILQGSTSSKSYILEFYGIFKQNNLISMQFITTVSYSVIEYGIRKNCQRYVFFMIQSHGCTQGRTNFNNRGCKSKSLYHHKCFKYIELLPYP